MTRSSAYEQAKQSLRKQEVEMRKVMEQRNRALMALLKEIAFNVAPEEYNRRRYANPHFPANLIKPEQWREFFEAASFGKQEEQEEVPTGWQLYATEEYQEFLAVKKERDELQQEVRQLAQENERLTREKHRLGARIQALQSQQPATAGNTAESDEFWPTLPEIPDKPPAQFEASFLDDTWERDAFAILFLAVSGWAFRYAVNEAIVEHDENISSPQSGTFNRMWKRLRRNNLTSDTKYPIGRTNVVVITLTEHGKTAARAIAGIEPTPSEWDTLLEKHGGEEQAVHNAGVVLFCYRARQRGYTVELCPDVDHAAEPDVLLGKGDERLYVEVESGSGTKERLMRKWRNMADLQGSVALCAHTPEQQKHLAAQAKKVARHGKTTNLYDLKPDKDGGAPDELWLETW